jgi:transposase InsO family protein
MDQLQRLEEAKEVKAVVLGNSTSSKVSKVGVVDLEVRTSEDGPTSMIGLENTLFVPKLRKNLLSITCLMRDGIDASFKSSDMTCMLKRGSKVVGRAILSNNLWVLDTVGNGSSTLEKNGGAMVNVAQGKQSMEVWHLRFNHLNQADLRRMAKDQVVRGLDINGNGSLREEHCFGCLLGKQHRESFGSATTSERREPLALVHSDLVGPMEVETIQSRKRYILTFIDDCTRRSWIYLIRSKDEVFHWFKVWRAMVEVQSGHKVKVLRSDGGGEYISNIMKTWMAGEGVIQEFTIAYSPEQNGVAERFNRTLVEGVRSMLYGSGLSKSFWGEAALCFNHTRNRCPTKGLEGGKTPFEAWTGVKPSVHHLRPFGCKVSVHIDASKRRKLDPKAFEGTFLGYSLDRKGYRVWDSKRQEVIDSRDVVFFEDAILKRNLAQGEQFQRSECVDGLSGVDEAGEGPSANGHKEEVVELGFDFQQIRKNVTRDHVTQEEAKEKEVEVVDADGIDQQILLEKEKEMEVEPMIVSEGVDSLGQSKGYELA